MEGRIGVHAALSVLVGFRCFAIIIPVHIMLTSLVLNGFQGEEMSFEGESFCFSYLILINLCATYLATY